MREASRSTETRSRPLEVATVLLFALFLMLPSLAQVLAGEVVASSEYEARLPEPPPSPPARLEDLRTFARGFEGWYGDRFGLRGTLLRARAVLCWFAGGSPSPLLARGRGDWVYWDGRRALDAWRGVDPLPDETAEAWRRLLEDRRDLVEARGVRYLVVLVPSKAHIYPEHLPRGIERHGPSRLEQVLGALECSGVDVLDLRASLIAARAADEGDDLVYYRLGFHWTTRGAQAAAAAIAERLVQSVPGLGPPCEGPYVVLSSLRQGDSWARRMALEGCISQRAFVYEPAGGWSARAERRSARDNNWINAAGAARGILLHDSFGLSMVRPLAESFGELRAIDTYDLDPTLLDDLLRDAPPPDVVIQLVSEQGLSRFAPSFTPFVEAPPAAPAEELARRFESSTEILLRVVLRTNQPPVRPVGAARVSAAREWTQGGLRVVLEDQAAAILLPAHRPWPGRGILHLGVQVPQASHLDLVSTPDGRLTYDPRRSRRVALERGRNRISIELEPELLAGRLVIRPTLHGRQVQLFHIELRGVD